MDTLDPGIISHLISPVSWAAFAGALLAVLLIISKRLIERAPNVDNSWQTFAEKLGAVVGSMAAGLLAVQEDTTQAVLTPILSSLLVVGLGVGLYRAIGEVLWKSHAKAPDAGKKE